MPAFCQCGCGHRWARSETRHPGFVVDPASGCWFWQGYVNHVTGYGGMRIEGRVSVSAHRAYYLKHRGQIPAGYALDHLCRTKRCVNPAHLEAVSGATNTRRGPQTRLTEAQVADMRALVAGGAMQKDVAWRFGIARSHVSKIVSGRKWA